MKYLLIIFLAFTIIPAFGQEPMIGDYLEPSNPSLIIQQTEIPYSEFNKVKSNTVIVDFENIHAGSWQAELHNDLLYGNPDGDAVIRIYDLDIPEKFFEIGMGSHPRYSYWIAAAVPETGYVLLYSAYENGWAPGNPTKITYSEQNGLFVDNGLRTVLSNLDISPFAIKSYSVHGMKGSTDPPAVTDGVFTVKIISADYGENPLSLFPFIVTGIIGAGVIVLIFSKKRS
uniref:Uncharacterized protein n=1 Tax=uncultured marine thaumarchaeote SAT1000_15_E07 TaxID=1456385 RepID=A0A075IB85_9ARCH|nr:hypothetical protein [uncultured marine thaumarchaeote SAT1000_15_E07]